MRIYEVAVSPSGMFGQYTRGIAQNAADSITNNMNIPQKTQQNFVKQFVQSAMTSIESAVESGIINPKLQTTQSNSVSNNKKPNDKWDMLSKIQTTQSNSVSNNKKSDDDSDMVPKIQPQIPNNKSQYSKTANFDKNTKLADPYEKLKGQLRKLHSQPNAKQLPATFIKDLQSDIAKLSKGDKESGIYAADKILKFANKGYDVSKLAPNWIAGAKTGERFLTQSVYREITNILKEHGLKWANLGIKIRLDESINGEGIFISKRQILPLIEDQNQGQAESISQFLVPWFSQYMQGIHYDHEKVNQLINDVEQTYDRDRGKAALTKLAMASYALAQRGPNKKVSDNSQQTTSIPQNNSYEVTPEMVNYFKDHEDELKKLLNSLIGKK
jgi:hypothetical protein